MEIITSNINIPIIPEELTLGFILMDIACIILIYLFFDLSMQFHKWIYNKKDL
jgi:hypothetical protein